MANDPQLTLPNVSDGEIEKNFPGAARTALKILDSWGLSNQEARKVLNVGEEDFDQLKSDPGKLKRKRPILLRISYVLGIRAALESIFPLERKRVVENPLVCRRNKAPTFNGRTPLELMMEEDPEGLKTVRQWLEGHMWN